MMTKDGLIKTIKLNKAWEASWPDVLTAVDAYTESLLQQDNVKCSAYRTWLQQVNSEQKHYPMFSGRDLDESQLFDLWQKGKSPIDALNDLATAC